MNIINYNFGKKIAFSIVLSTLVMLIVNLDNNIKLADAKKNYIDYKDLKRFFKQNDIECNDLRQVIDYLDDYYYNYYSHNYIDYSSYDNKYKKKYKKVDFDKYDNKYKKKYKKVDFDK